jgi:hypothetical protein
LCSPEIPVNLDSPSTPIDPVVPDLFGLLTARLEDAAALAAGGQARAADPTGILVQLGATMAEADILQRAIVAVAEVAGNNRSL